MATLSSILGTGFSGYTGSFGYTGSKGDNGFTGSSGGAAQGVVWENTTNITSNYTMGTGKNGVSVGPITVADGVTTTVPSGQRWVIL